MPWNEPGNNGNKDPWGNRKKQDGPPEIDEILKKVTGIFGGGKRGGTGTSGSSRNFFVVGALVLATLWGVAGIYTVNEAESGVILRFGKYHTTVGPGLGWRLWGIDKIYKVNTNELLQARVDGRMLTKDINIVDVEIGLQYRIIDPEDYLFNLSDPKQALVQASESALRQVLGDNSVDAVLTSEKERIRNNLQQELVTILDNYKSGIQIETVTLERALPPRQVNDAFEEVNRAEQDAKREVQDAQAYSNRALPLAEAEAEKMRQQADAYKIEALARARGEIARFEQLLPQYVAAPEVTRQRLYLETLEKVMSRSTKVMIDVEGGNNMMYIPLDKIMNKRTSGEEQK
ncbi:FtsH protease activity modulator HflK [Aliikangiella coralliicola]|uniref:Protein HflK n=1 Tax=Aliikangiella coralliicola TaxID=2592383 RepID=A0A545UBW7_9GAMM|nr:FtsH protease activity modulator HflK [Aliikangiella coralliicola]TQV86960.1 FtsH protease activity modulator HflK [Aliikangiella coralliicola]